MLRSLLLNINCVELLSNDDKQRCLILNALIKKIFKTVPTYTAQYSRLLCTVLPLFVK